MPTIAVFMKELGCKQFETNFYYPPVTHPHVHIGVSNSSLVLSNLYEVRKEIKFISLSWGHGGIVKKTIELYRRKRYESLENNKWSIPKKTKFEAGLSCFGRADHEAILKIVNLSTGIGLDYF